MPVTCPQPIPAVNVQKDDELKADPVDDDPDDEVNTENDAQTTHYDVHRKSKGSLCNVVGHFMEYFATAQERLLSRQCQPQSAR